ncbi:MAG: hemin-degrading factor [Calditrichaeota bacterium]|nr:hemin-degrading factor [Calditrichota bacterium]
MEKQSLIENWQRLKAQGLKQKEIADQLDITEAELIASMCDGEMVVRIKPDWLQLFSVFKQLGEVKTVTRNDSAVIEKNGEFEELDWNPHASTVVGTDIDLRIFHRIWRTAFLVHDETSRYPYSIQFFDRFGTAVHKLFLNDKSKMDVLFNWLPSLRSDDQSEYEMIDPIEEKQGTELKQKPFDKEKFVQDWRNLKDTHDFYPLLMKHGIDRMTALRETDSDLAWQLTIDTIDNLLKTMSEQQIPIMIFVGNKGMIQIHSGPVKNIIERNQWINIMDSNLHFHLNRSKLAECWAVRKPTVDGDVHSIEVFDDQNELVVTFFGLRKPGKAETAEWRNYVQSTQTAEFCL